jgi:protein-S-isoprenylcysteine O-methyltransferase Ste14
MKRFLAMAQPNKSLHLTARQLAFYQTCLASHTCLVAGGRQVNSRVGERQSPHSDSNWRLPMPRYFAVLTILLMLGIVLTRVFMMRIKGVEAMKFGKLDKTDFFIPPFALFYFYLVFAAAFNWPTVSQQEFFHSDIVAWVGVALCLAGLVLLLWSLVSFGQSFRVGIDVERPDQLISTGAFAFSRNPIYVAFASILIGQFLIFPNWILLVYLGAATWLFHRQVLREEEFLKPHYGQEYAEYCQRVRRYL